MANIQDAPHSIDRASDLRFPHAPPDWSREIAVEVAQREQLTLGDDHWLVVRGLQEFFARHEYGIINLRELHDALVALG